MSARIANETFLVLCSDEEGHYVHLSLTLSWRRPISYKNQSTDLLRKSMDWFLYDIGLRHERVKEINFLTKFPES